ncbi:MAG TPA: kelch repeat-containing protein [candidate division Zixibacteria bacterium]|nr:kelch repeat-containing protein [candidate division Zixibacteria bacterium]
MKFRLAPALLCLVVAACAQASPSPSATDASASVSPLPPAATETPTATPAPSEPPAAGWRQLEAAGPAAREDHTWTVTPDGATAYLFGGRGSDGAAFADLWAYDLATDAWAQVNAQGPAARFGHSAAWVAGVGLVIFGGQAGADFFNDLWAFDPASEAWTQLPSAGDVPVARYGSCAGVGPDGRFWISHGFTSENARFADTRAYDFAIGSWTDETVLADRPIERCLHGCWWTDDGAFVLYAGQTTGVPALGDLWRLSRGERPGTNRWSEVTGVQLPPARNLYAAARWGPGTVVFGGRGADDSYLADAWLLTDDGTVTDLGLSGPSGRSGAELVPDAQHGRLLLFGGRNADGALHELWELRLPE